MLEYIYRSSEFSSSIFCLFLFSSHASATTYSVACVVIRKRKVKREIRWQQKNEKNPRKKSHGLFYFIEGQQYKQFLFCVVHKLTGWAEKMAKLYKVFSQAKLDPKSFFWYQRIENFVYISFMCGSKNIHTPFFCNSKKYWKP